MKLSIIIPTYNRVKLINYTLDSILAADDVEKEVLVIDDGSTDGTEELIKSNYPSVRYYTQKNQGAPKARNLGLDQANGEYVVFIDSDDLVEEGFFKSRLEFFETGNAKDAVYGPAVFFSGEGNMDNSLIIPRHTDYPLLQTGQESEILKNLLGGWYINPGGMIWKKSFLMKIGGFRTQLIINQDVDLVFRAILAGAKIAGRDGAKAFIREHHNDRVGVVKNDPEKINQIFNLRKYFKKELEVSNLWDEIYAKAMADYLFDMWTLYRKETPLEVKKYLEFSQSLNPNLQVKGGPFYRMAGRILGSKNAVILKQLITS